MTRKKPKVAIITRTVVRPFFIERAIQSVASQTHSDYIHVIINDGGDKEYIADALKLFPKETTEKIKVFHRKKMSGAPDTIFNESIDRVDSEYFAIHDDDDSWSSEFLEKTVEQLDKDKKLGAVVARTDKVVERVVGNGLIKPVKKTQWMSDVKVINLYRQCIDNQLTPISTLFRRSAYKEVGKFSAALPVVGDWEFGIRLLQRYDVDFIDPGYALAFYHHRKRKEGAEGHISSHEKHRYYTNKVMNQYLREELRDGRLGVGYIMSQLKYSQTNTANLARRLLPNTLSKRLKKRIAN